MLPIDLKGRRALVTGGNSGIGAAIVASLGEAGADVAINYLTHPEAAETGAYALGPEAGEWMQQATLAIRAHVPLDVLSDTIQPFPSFSGIYDAAVKELLMQIADMPRPVRPMDAQMASLSR